MNRKEVLEHMWTQRWNLNKAVEELEGGETSYTAVKEYLDQNVRLAQKALHSAQTTDANEPTEPVTEPDRPSVSVPGQKLLICPFADQTHKHKTQGKMRKGYPEGLVVHFTAGQCDSESDMIGTMDWGRGQGYAFWGIGPTGKIYQSHTLDTWGHHAGSSNWKGLGSSVSQYLVGVEIACAGKVDSSGKAWFGKTFSKDRLRHIPENKENIQAGYYLKYTQAQEDALLQLCLWLKANNPEVFNFDYVLGHDQVAGPEGIGSWRKNDPGGSLSMTMKQFQQKLKTEYAKVQS